MNIKKWECIGILCMYLIIISEARSIKLSKDDEINLNEQFHRLQKPSIKEIHNAHGEIYDCVDFYKQPAFDHPLLQNHTFHPQMRPSLASKGFSSSISTKSLKLKGGGCPEGSVPIRRWSKEDFVKIYKFTREYGKSNVDGSNPGTHFAILRTNSDQHNVKYYGVGGNMNVYNLSVEPSGYSSGEFIIQNGNDKIKFGWMVNPTLNKNDRIHLFQYLDAGQSHCFNTLCPGFINVNKDIPIDVNLISASERGKISKFYRFHVHQDVSKGNWWLKLGGEIVGFWPQQIFTTMKTSATYIAVGGEAYAPLDKPLPPMGNGYYPVEDPVQSAFCINFVVIDTNRQEIDPQDTETYTDDSHYGIYDVGKSGAYGRTIYYGGTILW